MANNLFRIWGNCLGTTPFSYLQQKKRHAKTETIYVDTQSQIKDMYTRRDKRKISNDIKQLLKNET